MSDDDFASKSENLAKTWKVGCVLLLATRKGTDCNIKEDCRLFAEANNMLMSNVDFENAGSVRELKSILNDLIQWQCLFETTEFMDEPKKP